MYVFLLPLVFKFYAMVPWFCTEYEYEDEDDAHTAQPVYMHVYWLPAMLDPCVMGQLSGAALKTTPAATGLVCAHDEQ